MAQMWNTSVYTYDLCGRVTDIVNSCRDGVYHFDYDKLGNLIHKKTPESETNYQYNALHQLVGMTNYDGFHNVISDYSGMHYDGPGNLTQQTITTPSLNLPGRPLVSGTVNYTYDNQDHLTREQSQRNLSVVNLGGVFGNFDNASVSDPADNLTSLRGVAFTPNLDNRIAADSNGAGYGYDLDGDATTEEGVSIQYDDSGRITAYDDATLPLHLRMGYRPDGLRAWKQVNGVPITYFLYDGDRLTMEFQRQSDGTAMCTRCYSWGVAGLEQIDYPSISNEPTIFYAFDPQGNLVNRLQGGVVLDLACFDAFGDWVGDFTYIGPGAVWIDPFSDPIGWGGQWGAYTDTPGYAGVSLGGARHAGLILLTHRYYNPDTGRFLTRDPIGYEGGVNVYAYTRNNPVMRSDPSGLSPDDDGGEEVPISETHLYHPAINKVATTGLAIGNAAAGLNPICNAATVVSGTNAEGKKVSKADRGWALAAIIPWGKVVGTLSKGGKWLGRLFEIKTMPVVSAQATLRSEQTIQDVVQLMKAGKFAYGDPPITGFVYKGTKYIEEGNHRMSAAIRIFMDTGDKKPMQELLNTGQFEYVDHLPPGASNRFTRFPLKVNGG